MVHRQYVSDAAASPDSIQNNVSLGAACQNAPSYQRPNPKNDRAPVQRYIMLLQVDVLGARSGATATWPLKDPPLGGETP